VLFRGHFGKKNVCVRSPAGIATRLSNFGHPAIRQVPPLFEIAPRVSRIRYRYRQIKSYLREQFPTYIDITRRKGARLRLINKFLVGIFFFFSSRWCRGEDSRTPREEGGGGGGGGGGFQRKANANSREKARQWRCLSARFRVPSGSGETRASKHSTSLSLKLFDPLAPARGTTSATSATQHGVAQPLRGNLFRVLSTLASRYRSVAERVMDVAPSQRSTLERTKHAARR